MDSRIALITRTKWNMHWNWNIGVISICIALILVSVHPRRENVIASKSILHVLHAFNLLSFPAARLTTAQDFMSEFHVDARCIEYGIWYTLLKLNIPSFRIVELKPGCLEVPTRQTFIPAIHDMNKVFKIHSIKSNQTIAKPCHKASIAARKRRSQSSCPRSYLFINEIMH